MSAMLMPGKLDKTWSSQSTWKLAGSPFVSSPAKKVEVTKQEKDDDVAMGRSADEENNDVETSENEDNPEAQSDDDSADEDGISEPESSNKDKNDITEAQNDGNQTTDEDDSISSSKSSSSSSSTSSSSDATIKPKKRRLVSPTPYTPAFPNLPSGRAWFARQAASGKPVAQPTAPKKERVPDSGAREQKKATPARKPRKEPQQPTRRSTRNQPEAGSQGAMSQQVGKTGSGRGSIKRATTTRSATASSSSRVDETASSQATSSPFEEDFSTTQPWMQPHSVRYEMDQRRPIDIKAAIKGRSNTTPFVPLVTPYEPPKRGPLLLKEEDGRMVDLGLYTGPIHRLALDGKGKLYVVDGKKKEKAEDKKEVEKEDDVFFVEERKLGNEKETVGEAG